MENAGIRAFIEGILRGWRRQLPVKGRQNDAMVQDRPRECDESEATIVAEFDGTTAFFELTDEDGEVTRIDGFLNSSNGGFGGAVMRNIVGNVDGATVVLSSSVSRPQNFRSAKYRSMAFPLTVFWCGKRDGGFQPSGFGGVGTIVLENPDANGRPTKGRLSGSFYVFGPGQ